MMKNTILFTACLVAMTCAAAETAANAEPAAPAREGMRARSHAAGDSATPSPELRERLLQHFDANKNGRLDPDEIEAAKKAKAERQAKRGEQRRPQNSDSPRRPQGGHEMSAETKARLLKKFDHNGNGEPDADEMVEVRKLHRAAEGNTDRPAAEQDKAPRNRQGGMRRRSAE